MGVPSLEAPLSWPITPKGPAMKSITQGFQSKIEGMQHPDHSWSLPVPGTIHTKLLPRPSPITVCQVLLKHLPSLLCGPASTVPAMLFGDLLFLLPCSLCVVAPCGCFIASFQQLMPFAEFPGTCSLFLASPHLSWALLGACSWLSQSPALSTLYGPIYTS